MNLPAKANAKGEAPWAIKIGETAWEMTGSYRKMPCYYHGGIRASFAYTGEHVLPVLERIRTIKSTEFFYNDFIHYFKTGKLPQAFDTDERLRSYIKRYLTEDARAELGSLCDYEFPLKDSTAHACVKTFEFTPQALAEGLICGALTAATAYYTGGASLYWGLGAGTLWVWW